MMHEFTRNDRMTFAGAERFADGASPLVGEYGPLVAIIDKNGLTAFVEDFEDQPATLTGSTDYLTDVAENILAACKGLTPKQMVRYLNSI